MGLFEIYGRIDPHTGVPIAGTIITGITTAFVACFIDLESLANTISLGTLQVFTFVNAGLIILRMSPPLIPEMTELERDKEPDEKAEASSERLGSNILDERSRLIPPTSSTAGNLNISHNTSTASSSSRVRSSFLPDDGGAILIREATRDLNGNLLLVGIESDDAINSERQLQLLEQNGSKPHLLTLVITICAVLSSRGMSHL